MNGPPTDFARLGGTPGGQGIVYQRIVEAHTYRVFGYEALPRHDAASPLAAETSVAAAERLRRVLGLGRRAGSLAGPRGGHWLHGHRRLFVNIRLEDLFDDDLLEPDHGLVRIADRVVLEVRDSSALVGGSARIEARAGELRSAGYSFAFDDLGTGYTALSSSVTLQPDFIKLAKSLVRGIDRDVSKRRVVLSLADIYVDTGARVVAVGIETQAECQAVEDLGVDLLQGSWLGGPE